MTRMEAVTQMETLLNFDLFSDEYANLDMQYEDFDCDDLGYVELVPKDPDRDESLTVHNGIICWWQGLAVGYCEDSPEAREKLIAIWEKFMEW
jgi:hypothetical protein